MKLSKQALIAAAVTGMVPAGMQAAPLNQNLVGNPSFEDVTGTSALIWGGNVSTYAYAQNYTGPGPAGSGARYWFGGGADPLTTQTLDLTGNSAAINAGTLNYNLSAFFSTYQNQLDYATLRALFLDVGDMAIGSAFVGGAAFVGGIPPGTLREWQQDSRSGLVPAGTVRVRLEIDGEKEPGVGNIADPYTDLVDFQLVAVPEPGTVSLFALGLIGAWVISRRRQ